MMGMHVFRDFEAWALCLLTTYVRCLCANNIWRLLHVDCDTVAKADHCVHIHTNIRLINIASIDGAHSIVKVEQRQ